MAPISVLEASVSMKNCCVKSNNASIGVELRHYFSMLNVVECLEVQIDEQAVFFSNDVNGMDIMA